MDLNKLGMVHKKMQITIKGIKIGNIFITTKKQLNKTDYYIEGKEVLQLLKRAVKEGKI